MFNLVALFTQLLFLFNEMIQMSVKGTRISEYFTDFWNQNDITAFPIYFLLQVILWTQVTGDMTYKTEMAIKILYIIVVLQAFIKFMFLVRIYERIGFIISTMSKLVEDVQGFIIFALCFNILFAILFAILETDAGSDYDGVWAPIKWMTYALRNNLHDF